MAIEQRADDAAVQDVVERGVMRLRRPVADEFVALAEAADAKAFLVRRSAPETAILRRVRFLDALCSHGADCIVGVAGVRTVAHAFRRGSAVVRIREPALAGERKLSFAR